MTTTFRHDPLPIGSVLRRRYSLAEVIGSGGISTVYRAVDHLRAMVEPTGGEVALKVVSAEADIEPWIPEILHREASHLRQLRHPNIVQVFDSDWDGPHHFLVLELLKGRTVGGLLRGLPRRALPLDVVLRIVEGAIDGLAHAHGRGIVHGDIKPNNLFVTSDGEVKLLDFGAAHAIDLPRDPAEDGEDFDAITPIYASPDILSGSSPGPSDDVFSLAVLTYVMLAGHHPFDGLTALEAQRQGLRPPPPPGLPRRRWAPLAQALSLDGRSRIDTVEGFAAGLARPRLLDRLLG